MANRGSRKHNKLHVLNGTKRADRHGDHMDFETATPERPLYLSGKASAVWDDIVPKLETSGVLALVDEFAIATFCELYAEFKSDPTEFPAAKLTQMRLFMCELGLTPASRPKIQRPGKPKDQPKNPFADI